MPPGWWDVVTLLDMSIQRRVGRTSGVMLAHKRDICDDPARKEVLRRSEGFKAVK